MPQTKKTKIVATIGPATESVESLKKLLKAGMNVMRLNFSHGSFEEHEKRVINLHQAMKETGLSAAIMQDLSGPKFRIGDFYQERVMLKEGDLITLTSEKIVGDEKRVSINYPTLYKELKIGSIIMVDDGKKKFEVVEIKNKDVICKIVIGGETKGRRSVNLPGAYLKISSLTDKDKEDLAFGLKHQVDIVAFSFVRRPEDVVELRAILDKAKSKAMILSKIETQEAVDNFDKILELSDAVMVARGDLAVEIGAESVPAVQKMIIRKANEAGRPVVTATQMLESMIQSPVPTRAEVSDVANAILDGTDAIMLSEETTLGKYPVEAVNVMSRVAFRMENDYLHRQLLSGRVALKPHSQRLVTDSVTASAVRVADAVSASHIVTFTKTGYTARMISRHRPHQRITAMTPDSVSYGQINLSFGCTPVLVDKYRNFDDVIKVVREYFLTHNRGKAGDRIIIATALPFGKVPDTNTVLVETL